MDLEVRHAIASSRQLRCDLFHSKATLWLDESPKSLFDDELLRKLCHLLHGGVALANFFLGNSMLILGPVSKSNLGRQPIPNDFGTSGTRRGHRAQMSASSEM